VPHPSYREDGSLVVRANVTLPAEEIDLRVTTSGGPGGQHANRSLTRVIASFRVAESNVLTEDQKRRVMSAWGPVVRSSASRFRSQRQNRTAAVEQLGSKLASALEPRTPRRATKPTKGSAQRRVDQKKARGRLKQLRGPAKDD